MSDPGSPPATDDSRAPAFAVETDQRFSRSLLFRLQRSFFRRRGLEAWRAATVPYYVTNNPRLARAYAEVFVGWMRDCCRGPLDEGQPLHIVEIGAGCGQFGYLFLRALDAVHRRSAASRARFRYVMTDLAESNVRYWQEHAAFRPFIERGMLEFAVFDAEHDATIRLLGSGEVLAPGSLRNPLGVIANYVLDGLPQDAFSFTDGRLHEWLVSLSAAEPAADLDDPELLARLEVTYRRQPAPLPYYGDPALDAILQGHAPAMEGKTFFFPHTAARCLERLARLAGDRLFLLSGDRGGIDPGAVADAGDPSITLHGSFSMDVNYHAIAEHVRARGGAVLEPGHRNAHLASYGFLLGASSAEYSETSLAYERAVALGGPDDFFTARVGIQEHYTDLGVQQLLALIRLSEHDPRIVRDCIPALTARAETSPEPLRQDVVRAVARAWESHYFIGEERDTAFELGVLAHTYGGWRVALDLYSTSIQRTGESARTSWNMGLCHYALGETEAALRCFAEAARIAPGFSPAGAVQTS